MSPRVLNACALGGPNPALPPTAAYSQAHFDAVMSNPELAELIRDARQTALTRAGELRRELEDGS